MNASVIVALITTTILTGCPEEQQSADSQQRHQQEQLSAESNMQVGMPAITNFQEKRNLKMITELRDTALSTISYTQDMNGHMHKLCDSIGYGIPAATQYTNPQRTVEGRTQGEFVSIAQADPNGLFSPASADGTWVLCLNPQTQKMAPVYVEPRVIVSPFPLGG